LPGRGRRRRSHQSGHPPGTVFPKPLRGMRGRESTVTLQHPRKDWRDFYSPFLLLCLHLPSVVRFCGSTLLFAEPLYDADKIYDRAVCFYAAIGR
jgi:hypothetical protein